ncbi:dclre1b, partial [Symbiodinium pilosum]
GKWQQGPIYASEVTVRLLRRRWPQLAPLLKPLAIGPIHRIQLGSAGGLEVEVSLVDANHVPGSVMLILAGFFGNLLYTGDFRLHDQHTHLSTSPLLVRPNATLERIFLDNTFCHPQFHHAPRSEVAKHIAKRLISKWPCIAYVMVYKLGKESWPKTMGVSTRQGPHHCTPYSQNSRSP